MYRDILIPVMLGEGHHTEKAIAVAQSLASSGARFTLLHVIEPMPSFIEANIHRDVFAEACTEIKSEMASMAGSLADPEIVVISGRAGQSIIDHAEKGGVDCIIIASHRPGLSNYFLGSTASRVVRHAKTSVHVLR